MYPCPAPTGVSIPRPRPRILASDSTLKYWGKVPWYLSVRWSARSNHEAVSTQVSRHFASGTPLSGQI